MQTQTAKHASRRLFTPVSAARRQIRSATSGLSAYEQKKGTTSFGEDTPRSSSPAQKKATNNFGERTPKFSAPGGPSEEDLSRLSLFPRSERVATAIKKNLPQSLTETYVAYSSCEKLVKECARQADYSMPQLSDSMREMRKNRDGTEIGVGKGWWYETVGLDPTFENWAQITFLHMYLITVRFRCFPGQYVGIWHQHLIDHFSYIAEEKMTVLHKMTMKTERQKHLKNAFVQWRGIQTGYDEGLIKGDAVLATAVWRNIFKADPNVDWRRVAEVVSYIRHILRVFADMTDLQIACGDLAFGGSPSSERAGVLLRSKGIDDRGGSDYSQRISSGQGGVR